MNKLLELHTKPFDITGRVMKGWALVERPGFESDDYLTAWVDGANSPRRFQPSDNPQVREHPVSLPVLTGKVCQWLSCKMKIDLKLQEMVHRKIFSITESRLAEYSAVLLVGARRVGKTTLARSFEGIYFYLENPGD